MPADPKTLQPVVSFCHGCQQYDDHPRAIVFGKDPAGNDVQIGQFHYDRECVPPEFHEALAPLIEAREAGARGEDMRTAAVEHANRDEDPADKPTSKKG